ncbi:hypothetical protein ARMSODRAFT_551120 [Armillaria solidipes]|uniref:Uncharacterized protein n=1 Tax=Armillaria solidipes TaxID=1076256 RepID=A0A2H3AZW3_9AGAR|nr:hypothetical protein ARMSODRAFT_551120 [Armillaria solidipes]
MGLENRYPIDVQLASGLRRTYPAEASTTLLMITTYSFCFAVFLLLLVKEYLNASQWNILRFAGIVIHLLGKILFFSLLFVYYLS